MRLPVITVPNTYERLSSARSGRSWLTISQLVAQRTPPFYHQELPSNDAMVDRSDTRYTTLGDFNVTVKPANALKTVFASNSKEDKQDEPGDVDKQTRSATDTPSSRHKRLFTCENCGYTFGRHSSLERHKRTYAANFKKLSCGICHKGFCRRSLLKQHEDNTHGNKDNTLCDVCGKVLGNQIALKNHIKTHTEELIFFCQYCDRNFNSLPRLITHTQRHSSVNKQQCNVCHQEFNRRQHLMRHMKAHDDGRERECQECGIPFVSIQSLARHKASEHGKGELYQCSICRDGFVTTVALKKHRETYHQTRTHTITSTNAMIEQDWTP